jgi:hypothetical protein
MGVAGWRLAHGKRNLSGRAGIVAVLTGGSMIMLGIMLYRDWPKTDEYDAAQERGEVSTGRDGPGAGVLNGNAKATAADVDLSRKQILEARKIRDAEEREPKEGP